eukprot:COSAG02_NODE_4540_length_5235_cov_4.163357_1_plen_176_part_00
MGLPLVPLSDDDLYLLANWCVLPGWAVLAFCPRWRLTPAVSMGVIATYCILYLLLLVGSMNDEEPLPDGAGARPTWADIVQGQKDMSELLQRFANRGIMLAGWVHFTGEDLLAGRFIVLDAQQAGLPHLAVVWLLPVSLIVGPVGLGLYVLVVKPIGYAVQPHVIRRPYLPLRSC